jgi:hypothetical protein
MLKLTLKLNFPRNYFLILVQIGFTGLCVSVQNSDSLFGIVFFLQSIWFKIQNPSIWKTLKFGRETIVVQPACLASCDSIVVQSAWLASWGS